MGKAVNQVIAIYPSAPREGRSAEIGPHGPSATLFYQLHTGGVGHMAGAEEAKIIFMCSPPPLTK